MSLTCSISGSKTSGALSVFILTDVSSFPAVKESIEPKSEMLSAIKASSLMVPFIFDPLFIR